VSDLHFRLDLRAPERRRIVISLEVDRDLLAMAPDATDAADFFLPTWTPGSYLIREYARHLGPVHAIDVATAQPLRVEKTHKNRFRVHGLAGVQRVRLDYWAYAHELTVRTCDVTAEHAYWNHACILLWPVGKKTHSAKVRVDLPDDWTIAGGCPVTARPGVAHYELKDLDTAIDSPFLAGCFRTMEIETRGVRHQLALDGVDGARIDAKFERDVRTVLEKCADVFDGSFPYPHYTFLCLFADSGYGGLEHTDSTTLLSPRTALAGGKPYQEFLGLLAHELFHAWNVKRMRPAELWDYDYEVENLTPMLWLAEGWTAYYDDLICRRAQLLTTDDYLSIVAKNMTALWSGMGRFRQSLHDASFDAWIRYYRPDENTRNSTQNYYGNGALAAMVLDLTIRKASNGERNLDDAIRALYRETFEQGRGYRLDDVERCLSQAAGVDIAPLLAQLTRGPLDPDFTPLLAEFGLKLEAVDRDRPYLGFALEGGSTRVQHVTDDSPAYFGSIAPGDEVIALEGLRVTSDRWADIVRSVAIIGQPLRVLLATRGVIRERIVTPIEMPRLGVRITFDRDASERATSLRQGWLGVDAPAPAK
jgi:predicted metalloprotease with PDZ domain